MEHLVKLLNENAEQIKDAIVSLARRRDRVGRKLGFNSQEVGELDARIHDLKQELRDYGRFENVDPDGEDEFDFDMDDYEDDGQPTDYEEWQDYMGGDDWDHGQFDAMEDDEEPEMGDDLELDDEPELDMDDDSDDDDYSDDGGGEFDYDADGDLDDHEDDHDETAERLDDLEDKLNMLLQKFASVLAQDVVDDEPEMDDEEEPELDLDDEESDDEVEDPADLDIEDDDEDVEEWMEPHHGGEDRLPQDADPDDYDYQADSGDYRGPDDYEGNVRRKRMVKRRNMRWKEFRSRLDELS